MFVDGLSLDRFRHLIKKLTNLPLSFCPAFKQGLIFQKPLDRVVEVNVLFHMAFNMLQCVYNIYRTFMTWYTQVLKWKRIKMSAISDYLNNANYFHKLLFQEFERLTIDRFFIDKNDIVSSLFSASNYSVDTFFCLLRYPSSNI